MASKKTLAILEILVALTRYFEVIAEEESANETEQSAVIPGRDPESTESPTVVEEVVEEEVSPFVEMTRVETTTTNVAENTLLPTPVPKLYDVVQPAPTMSAEEYAEWEQRTQSAVDGGNFRTMGALQDELKGLGLHELVRKVSDEFDVRNIAQAKSLRDDRDSVLRSLERALGEKNLQVAREIFEIDMTRVGDRLAKLKRQAQIQLEHLEGKTFGEVRNEFLEYVRDASEKIEALEHAAEQREREQIEQALADEVDEKTARRINEWVSRFQTNISQQALGAAESCYNDMLANRLQLIAHFKNKEKVSELLHGAFVLLETLRQQKAEQKQKNKSNGNKLRQLQSA